MNTKNREQIEIAYLNAHQRALDLIDRLRGLIEDRPAPGDDEHPINWGHVGDLGHANELLDETIAFLTGEDR
jgi:hypothetical protein